MTHNLLLFCGACLATCMSLGQLLVRDKRPRNYLFALLFAAISGVAMVTFLHNLELLSQDWDLVPILLTGPCLFFLYIDITSEDFQLRKGHFVHGLPSAIFLILNVAIVFGVLPKWGGFGSIVGGVVSDFAFIGALFVTFIYMIVVLRGTTFVWTLDLKPGQRPAQLIIFSAAGISVSVLFTVLFLLDITLLRNTIYPHLLSASIFYSILIGHRYPELYQLTVRAKPAREYKKSSLNSITPRALSEKLENALEKDKIYEDDEITLRSLAAHIDVTPHQLSEYINVHMGSNFSNVVNSHRINAAAKLLIEQPNMEILTIAYQVGFGSKTSFNRAFGLFMSQSPTEYRRQSLNKKK